METKKVTLLEIAQAIQMNGFPKLKNSFGGEQAACAIGQGALNLGVTPNSLQRALDTLHILGFGKQNMKAGNAVTHLNDATDKSVGEIGKELVKYAEKWPDLQFDIEVKK